MMYDSQEEAHRSDLADAIRATPKHSKLSTIDAVRKVVEEKQCARIGGVLVDLFTASAIVQVHDALNPVNQAKFAGLPIRKMASVTWKLVGK